MKPSTKQFRPTLSKIMMALALASVLGVASITSVLSKGKDDHQNATQKNAPRAQRNDNRGRRAPYHRSAPAAYYSAPAYYQSEPVYAPPPVYYAPQPSPVISFILPLDIRF